MIREGKPPRYNGIGWLQKSPDSSFEEAGDKAFANGVDVGSLGDF